jgi:hypothetical protein
MRTQNMNKLIWNEEDFEKMSWHDNFIHALSYDPDENEFLLDIDYLFEWISPKDNENHYTFGIAPSTLIFEGVYDLNVDISIGNVITFDIYEVKREPVKTKFETKKQYFKYTMILDHVGEITFSAFGFRMYMRNAFLDRDAQALTREERGGVSFSIETASA